jgi:dipeptidyl aminopeptidase/acylaminoacyl peptidase
LRRRSPPDLVLLPTGAGEPLVLKNQNISDYTWADWVPDGKRIVFNGTEAGHGPRCFVQGIDGGAARPITPEGTTLILGQRAVSPDGESVAAIGQDGKAALYPLAGGPPRPIPGLEPGDVPIRWSVDERSLFVFRKTESTPKVYLINLSTGRNELWREIVPPDPAGIVNVWGVHVGPDERSYYYSYMRTLSDLYLMEGLK